MKRLLLLIMLVLVPVADAAPAPTRRSSRRRAPRPVELVWHVEAADGQVLEEKQGDLGINPASVVKVATSLWALERLGPDFRYETRFWARGVVDAAKGVLTGDLIVQGSGDPDFQFENAFLVAEALNRMGIRKVTGALVVNRLFWMGWEGGSDRIDPDPVRRGQMMARRLKDGFDSRRWGHAGRRAWSSFALRRGLHQGRPPQVLVGGGVGVDGDSRLGDLLLVHRSKPLVATLHRFNAYSANDIERVGTLLGPPAELAGLLAVRCQAPTGNVQIETTSGLGTNRLTPRVVARLLRELRATCERLGLKVEDVLPAGGCIPGTVTSFFPRLAKEELRGCLVGKTGTLTTTDGGVAVLAGFLNTAEGEVVFCVAAPRAGGRLRAARAAQEAWVLDQLARRGGGRPVTCGAPLAEPDEGASIIEVAVAATAADAAPLHPSSR